MSAVENEMYLREIQSLVTNIIKEEEYLKPIIEITPIGNESAHYLGVLHAVTIKSMKKNCKSIDLIIKLPSRRKDENIISMKKAFASEAFFYNELSKLFDELQNEANIPADERYAVARCYSSDVNAIVLENLTAQGYKTYKPTDVVSIEFAEMSMKELAKFHALSFALQVKKPECLELFSSIKMPWVYGDMFRSFVDNISKVTINALKGIHREKYKSIVPIIYNEFFKIYSDTDTVRCLCHGDFKVTNIMTLEMNGKPSRIIPIDYQNLNYSSPVTDFIYFITLCTDQEFRKTYLKYLKDIYFQTLTEYLKKFDIDVETVLPRVEFERAYKEKLILTLILVTGSMPFLYIDENKPDFGDPDQCALTTNDVFARKAKEFVEEYFDI